MPPRSPTGAGEIYVVHRHDPLALVEQLRNYRWVDLCHTLAVDASGSEAPAHYTLLGNEVYIVENLKNLDNLPPFCFFVAFPLKIKGGSGSPVRAVGLFREEG